MKKLVSIIILAFACSALVGAQAMAVDPAPICDLQNAGTGDVRNSPLCEANQDGRNALFGTHGLITNIAQLLVYITGIISVISITIAGVRYAASNGDAGQIQSAKNTLIYALVGLIVAIFAQAIVRFVLVKL